ncbi:PEP-CTERM protein-sorting domain-containing protein [Marinobacter sp. es.048]|uniref:PEP-CTERM sorting domain-containing protein n=1 Tax=Marinobacter sp. es.048 TaxID=1761795 RepID=UPI000B58A142|nr:PEP-CTERM sorting domain-containing protein [Marinobacter sp. es.048]SNC68145.1 PEP-CTERM protein-sorting domain-containing protein [Marinobacter sp. es.048]
MKKLFFAALLFASSSAISAPIPLSEIVNNTQPFYNGFYAVNDGLRDAYDGFQRLENYGSLSVSREVFTLEDIFSYGVYDSFTNNTGSVINQTIRYFTNLGSDDQPYVSSTTDYTYTTNETQLGRDPAVAFTFGKNQWTLDNSEFLPFGSAFTYLYYDLTVDAGETVSLLTFSSLYLDSVANSINDLKNAELTALALSLDPISQGVSSRMVNNAINYSDVKSVPEPGSLALLFLGLTGILFSRKKKLA